MASPSVDYIRHRLQKFEQAVDDTSLHLPDLPDSGRWCASAPYYEKCMIQVLLNSSDIPGDDYSSLQQDYLRIVNKLESFRDRKGQVYRDLLLSDLRNHVYAYHAEVCYANLGNAGTNAGNGLSYRELIDELCRELKEYYDLSAIEALIALLDKNVPAENGPVLHYQEDQVIPQDDPSGKISFGIPCSASQKKPSARQT